MHENLTINACELENPGKPKNTKELEELYGQPADVPGKKTPAGEAHVLGVIVHVHNLHTTATAWEYNTIDQLQTLTAC